MMRRVPLGDDTLDQCKERMPIGVGERIVSRQNEDVLIGQGIEKGGI